MTTCNATYTNPAQMLPDDMLADVLGRLPLRSLAVSRCVCTEWRAVIDARRLLRPDLLPLSLAGIFVNYSSQFAYSFAELFSRHLPKAKKPVSTYPYPPHILVDDHCNGLLLVEHDGVFCVLNPATGWRMALPEFPRPAHAGTEDFRQNWYLVFDPTMSSSQFEVFLIPRVPRDSTREEFDQYGKRIYYGKGIQIDAALLASQWPLSPCILNVFSSAKGRWEERAFDRDGEGAGTVADMRIAADLHLLMRRRNAVYFRGALYVHCEYDFVMRISLSTNKYHMIKPPPTVICEFPELHLGKSLNGIYFALVGDEDQLWVWILAETNGQTEWILRHDGAAGLLLPSLNCVKKIHAPWILHRVTKLTSGSDDQSVLAEHTEFEWTSDNDEEEIILHNEDNGQTHSSGNYLEILAFHPYKEILFLRSSMGSSTGRGLAYHLNSSKLEDLGDLSPDMPFIEDIGKCFPYTPCWL